MLCCRFHNKGVYFQLALQKMVTKKVTAELSKHIAIAVRQLNHKIDKNVLLFSQVDSLPLQLPDLEGIVILNIQRLESYYGLYLGLYFV